MRALSQDKVPPSLNMMLTHLFNWNALNCLLSVVEEAVICSAVTMPMSCSIVACPVRVTIFPSKLTFPPFTWQSSAWMKQVKSEQTIMLNKFIVSYLWFPMF